jgi:hypothetical protein
MDATGSKGELHQAGIESPGENDQATLDALRGVLVAHLRANSSRVEKAIIARVLDVSAVANDDPEGFDGLREFASGSIDAIARVIEQGANWTPSLSPAGAARVRYAARNGIALDTIMQAYYSISTALLGLLVEEIAELPPETLPYMMGIQSQHGHRLMGAITAEYESEIARLDRSPAKRIARCVEKLLAGEPADAAELGYDLELWHLGVIALGPKAELFARGLAERLGCRLLFLARSDKTGWFWLGAKRAVPFAELERSVLAGTDKSVSLAVGEPREGADGWQVTHREAQTALAIVLRKPQRLTRCSDVVLPAAVLRDEEMSRFLVDAYLKPLDECRDAEALCETLRAYVSHDCNAASAAASLGVDRHTVQRRLRRVEQVIDRPLDACRAELEVALRIDGLSR